MRAVLFAAPLLVALLGMPIRLPLPAADDPLRLTSRHSWTDLALDREIRCRRLSIEVEWTDASSGKGVLELDPNSCQYDAFGDVTARTEMAPRRFEISLRNLEEIDRTGRERTVWAIEGHELARDLTLVHAPKDLYTCRLLVRERGGRVLGVVELAP